MIGCRPLSDDEIKAVLETLERPRDVAMFVLGLKSGFRISELLSLRVCDVFQYGKVVERVTVQRKNMKRKFSSRTVRLHPEAAERLLELIQEEGLADRDFLFQSSQGPKNTPLSRFQAWRILKKAFAENQLQGTVACHSLRKSFAARVYERLDHDLVKTAKALGHRNVSSTVSYLSFDEAEIDEAVVSA